MLFECFQKLRMMRKLVGYEPLVPPFDKPPIDFAASEARAYFDWYMERLPGRCDVLIQKAAAGLRCEPEVFDYRFESLIPLWRWFLSDAELTRGADGLMLSVYSLMVLRDIGMYVGETFVREFPDVLQWTYKRTPKNYIHVNEPLVTGFVGLYDVMTGERLKKPGRTDFEPIHMAHGRALKLLDGTADEKDLYTLCLRHAEKAQNARILRDEEQSAVRP